MAAIVAVIVAIIVGGLVTPRDHVVSRSVLIPDSVDAVWNTVRDFGRYGEWRTELEDSSLIDPEQPQIRWRETSTRGSVAFGVTEERAPNRLVARILDEDLPFSGEWSWQLTAEGSGTRVTITERGSVPNPIFRFIASHFIGFTKSMDGYLSALARQHRVATPRIDPATPPL